MNNTRRKAIASIMDEVSSRTSQLQTLLDEEQEYYDNMPEGLQASERGDTAQNAINSLESAVSLLEEATDNIREALE